MTLSYLIRAEFRVVRYCFQKQTSMWPSLAHTLISHPVTLRLDLALSYGICGKQSDKTLGQVFLKVRIWVSAASIIHPMLLSHSLIYHRRYIILAFDRAVKYLLTYLITP